VGRITQRDIIVKAITNPIFEPKESLKMAPLYPINADISMFNRIRILPRSIGFRQLIATMAFSIG
jgi:hypothetical protein